MDNWTQAFARGRKLDTVDAKWLYSDGSVGSVSAIDPSWLDWRSLLPMTAVELTSVKAAIETWATAIFEQSLVDLDPVAESAYTTWRDAEGAWQEEEARAMRCGPIAEDFAGIAAAMKALHDG
jgi:hypothetical protein